MNSELAAAALLASYAFVVLLVILLQVRRAQVGWRVWLLYVLERIYVGMFLHWRANRLCPFPETGPALIISNHRSPVDPMVLWMNHHQGSSAGQLRVMRFLMAAEYYELFGLHWVFKHLQAIPIERDGHDMKPVRTAYRCLQEGDLITIFPEGGIRSGPDISNGSPGIAWLALKSRVPVYPVYVHNSPLGRNMIEPFCRPERVTVSYGDPVDLTRYYGRKTSHALLREVTDLLMTRLAELGEADYLGLHDAGRRPRDADSAERATG